jgi:HEAT repeat protein
MPIMDLFGSTPVDPENLKTNGDVPALIRLLDHPDPVVRAKVSATLGSAGVSAVPPLVAALRSPKARIRLGATEALGTLGDIRAVTPLLELFYREKNIEIQWAVVIALGEIGSPAAIPDLVLSLKNPNRYVRYGAALSLENLGWKPPGVSDRIAFLIALQDWESVKKYGTAAFGPLADIFTDTDPDTRATVVALMGEVGGRDPPVTCMKGLMDQNPRVRWASVLASMNCGVRSSNLPPFVASRQRTGPDPAAAALLNFLFLGIGYNYLGKWWGFPVFMAYMSILVLAQLYAGPFLPYLIAYPVTAILGIHTYVIAERMSDL